MSVRVDFCPGIEPSSALTSAKLVLSLRPKPNRGRQPETWVPVLMPEPRTNSASHHDFKAAEETPTRLNPQEGLPAATLPVPSLAAQAGRQRGRRAPQHPASAGGSAPPPALPPSRPCRPGMKEGCHAA